MGSFLKYLVLAQAIKYIFNSVNIKILNYAQKKASKKVTLSNLVASPAKAWMTVSTLAHKDHIAPIPHMHTHMHAQRQLWVVACSSVDILWQDKQKTDGVVLRNFSGFI